MPDTARAGEMDFPAAREQIEKELEGFFAQIGQTLEIPAMLHERGETIFRFHPPGIDKKLVFEALDAIKKHVENLRIHTFEEGYIVFQSMGPNLFDSSSITSGTKFKFTAIGSISQVEVSCRGNFTQDEVLICIRIFKLFFPKTGKIDPTERLLALGVGVYSEKTKEENPWDWIAGYEQTKMEIQESLVLPLRYPEMFQGVAKLTRGENAHNLPQAVLFTGPPGVGKTTMAHIIAATAGIPLVYVPVENILSKYYGESAHNMAAIFDTAAEFERVILFLDEIDSLAGSRQEGMIEATRRILSVLLRKIDGFESREGVLTIGATNRAEDLDHALLSRFDQTIDFPLPGLKERSAIFQLYARQLKPEELQRLGKSSEGLSGRNIKDICEYAERRWARKLLIRKTEPSAPPASLYEEVTGRKKQQSMA